MYEYYYLYDSSTLRLSHTTHTTHTTVLTLGTRHSRAPDRRRPLAIEAGGGSHNKTSGQTRKESMSALSTAPLLNSAPGISAAAGATKSENAPGDVTMAPANSQPRAQPNILVTGTPGTGKTSTCALAAEITGLCHVDCSRLITDKQLHDPERNEEFDCWMLDEDALCDELEDQMTRGGNIVDFHSVNFFPERWFDLVLVLRTDNTILYDRLQKRNYSQKKLTENVTCEIMQVLLEEARSSYDVNIVHEVQSNTVDELESNVDRIKNWVLAFRNQAQSQANTQ